MRLAMATGVGLVLGAPAFRPPAIPLITTDPYLQSFIMGDNSTDGNVKHWDQRDKEMVGLVRIDGEAYTFLGGYSEKPTLQQVAVSVQPTRTIFQLRDPQGRIELNVTFLSTLFADDYARLSRPVSYIIHDVRSLSAGQHDVQLYLDATAQWTVDRPDEAVEWQHVDEVVGSRLGTQTQDVLGRKGDKTNINWGYLYLTAASANSSLQRWSGSAKQARQAFVASGGVPTDPDTRMPRACNDDLPALAVARSCGPVGHVAVRHTALLAYDDVKSVRYYDEGDFAGFWTQSWTNISTAVRAAAGEVGEMLAKSEQHDAELWMNTTAVGGAEYAQICALAYRQTLAATKLVWNSKRGVMWNFLKEISTNGDMQTMDVVYPASPMLIYSNPVLLRELLIPVLAFANNETSTPYSDSFSPHEIGTYPIADHNTEQQEQMPMENTGNMFLMAAAIIKADPSHDASWVYPRYWPLLTSWADYLVSTLPFPEKQICTDDFTGPLGNNTNLAAKGIVALEAFATICEAAQAGACDKYRAAARGFAKTWKQEAWETDHFRIAYDFPHSYSIKYNMVWQKILGLDGPFEWNAIVPTEVKYYISKANQYGTPMDSRHTYVKLDWLSWGAAMADDEGSFHALQDPIYRMAEASPTRVPLNDLYDTITAVASSETQFVDRPVVGGVFAKMLTPRARDPAPADVIFA